MQIPRGSSVYARGDMCHGTRTTNVSAEAFSALLCSFQQQAPRCLPRPLVCTRTGAPDRVAGQHSLHSGLGG